MLSSGNVVFDSRSVSIGAIERKIEAVLLKRIGRGFYPVVRSVSSLERLLKSDPYLGHPLPSEAKRVVSFLRKSPRTKLSLPIERDGASILSMEGAEIFTAYVPHPKGPVFMVLIQKAFGDEVTTRTWETVKKCAVA